MQSPQQRPKENFLWPKTSSSLIKVTKGQKYLKQEERQSCVDYRMDIKESKQLRYIQRGQATPEPPLTAHFQLTAIFAVTTLAESSERHVMIV